MAETFLTFELDSDAQTLSVHGDVAGLRFLQQAITSVVESTKEGHFNHDHLKTPKWGGTELSEESQGGKLIHHVKLYCWKGDASQH